MIQYSMIPSFYVIIALTIGISIQGLIDYHIDSSILIALSLACLTLLRMVPQSKLIAGILLGMFIAQEADNLTAQGVKGHAIRMRGFMNGEIIDVRNNGNSITCIIEGYIDTPQLPRIEHCRINVKITGKTKPYTKGMTIIARGVVSQPKSADFSNEFNELRYMQSNQIQWKMHANDKDIAITNRRSDKWFLLSQQLHDWIQHAILALFPGEESSMAKALLLGDTSAVDPQLKHAFSLLGTAHILSVSGFHAGLIALMIAFFATWIPSPFVKQLFLVTMLIIFLQLVQWDPPALRACCMTAYGSIMKECQRDAHPLHILFSCGGFMICFEPQLLQSIGFQLSIIGMLGMILLYDHVHTVHINVFPRVLAHSLSSTIAAMIVLLPLTAWYFDLISYISPITNMMFIPLFALSLTWMLMALTCYTCSTSMAEIISGASAQTIRIANEMHSLISSWEWIACKGEHALWLSLCIVITLLMIYQSRNIAHLIISIFAGSIFLIGMNHIGLALYSQRKNMHIQRRQDFIAGYMDRTLLIVDRDLQRYNGKDKAFVDHVISDEHYAKIVYSGRASGHIARSIKAIDSSIEIKECKRSVVLKCLHSIKEHMLFSK